MILQLQHSEKEHFSSFKAFKHLNLQKFDLSNFQWFKLKSFNLSNFQSSVLAPFTCSSARPGPHMDPPTTSPPWPAALMKLFNPAPPTRDGQESNVQDLEHMHTRDLTYLSVPCL